MKIIITAFLLISCTFVGYSQNVHLPQGVAEFRTMSSGILDTERSYSIYLPKSYSTAGPFSLVARLFSPGRAEYNLFPSISVSFRIM
ncbi:hypothetical protein HC174_04280 [Salinimicrobium sp. CDJ15-81-2]|nr:hypothetical protein [Salinimicrobium nanhaiense]